MDISRFLMGSLVVGSLENKVSKYGNTEKKLLPQEDFYTSAARSIPLLDSQPRCTRNRKDAAGAGAQPCSAGGR